MSAKSKSLELSSQSSLSPIRSRIPEKSSSAGSLPERASALPLILKAGEVAALLRVNRKTLYEAVQREQIPGVVRVGRCLRFQRDAVLGWLGQGGVISTRKDP